MRTNAQRAGISLWNFVETTENQSSKSNAMTALLIVNSILLGISLYFVKEFHTEFKEMSKKVTRLDGQVRLISFRLRNRERENQK